MPYMGTTIVLLNDKSSYGDTDTWIVCLNREGEAALESTYDAKALHDENGDLDPDLVSHCVSLGTLLNLYYRETGVSL